MIDTLGSLRASVLEWLEGSEGVPSSRANEAINDGIESLWETLMRASLSLFMGGPVTVTINAGAERLNLVTIADPTIAPALSAVTSGALDAHSVAVKYTYVTESGTETLPSPSSTLAVLVNQVGSAASPAYAANAIGWNCYGFSTNGPTTVYAKQNDEPIPFGTDFQEPDSGFINGPELPLPPTENTSGDDICYIRHLECQMPDQGYRTYQAADIDSLVMSRAAGSLATSSPYQNFYWDLINQRQLEFRPTPALTFNPRYFYIKRARRLAFDNSPLPFLTIPSVAFLRAYALSALSLSVREFESADAWESRAEKERTRCELAVVQMNRPRNQYITPFP